MPRSLYHPDLNEWPTEVWNPGFLAFKQNKLWGEVYSLSSLRNQAEAGTCPASSLLLKCLLLLSCFLPPPYRFLLGAMPWYIICPWNLTSGSVSRERDLRQSHLGVYLSIPKVTIGVHYVLCKHFLSPSWLVTFSNLLSDDLLIYCLHHVISHIKIQRSFLICCGIKNSTWNVKPSTPWFQSTNHKPLHINS